MRPLLQPSHRRISSPRQANHLHRCSATSILPVPCFAPPWSDEKAHLNSRSPKAFKNGVQRLAFRSTASEKKRGAGLDRPERERKFKPMVAVATCREPPFSLNGLYGISTADRPHSALMLRARITLPHFSVSSAMNLPKSVGDIGIG